MEWMNRGARQPQAAAGAAPGTTVHQTHSKRGGPMAMGARVAAVALLISAAVLIVALIALSVFGGVSSEKKYVDGKKLQAVFLNGGQVYFGNIRTLNEKYMRLGNIYYLRVNQQVQPNQDTTQANANDISLVKLGCELHGPADEMLINRDQIIFWENLKDDGQVAKAVAEYIKQNPNGQTCNTSTGTSTPTPTPTPTTTPTPTPTPAKKP
jgi:hypothetical protein